MAGCCLPNGVPNAHDQMKDAQYRNDHSITDSWNDRCASNGTLGFARILREGFSDLSSGVRGPCGQPKRWRWQICGPAERESAREKLKALVDQTCR
jgi:hypothetical protein